MLTHPTLNQLRALKLDGMADAFVELANNSQAADLTHVEWLALLLDREVAMRAGAEMDGISVEADQLG